MEQFGKYTLIKRIGAGGMAEVYLARTTVAQGLNKTLVIKKIHTAYAKSRQFITMFVDEAKIALGLNHPNIIQVFDFGAVGDTYFLAMEHVEGCDVLRLLQECAAQKRRIPYGVSAYVAQQIAKGLDYAHRKADEFGEPFGIVHRDISPQNVLLSRDGAVKIVDFGIARARDVHEDEGVIKGKFSYMSPEQARGEPVDGRSDVFAAGIVLYEMVCARPLFPGKGKEPLEAVKSGTVPDPRQWAPELPESLARVILRALAFHRDDRYQTARDLQQDLGRFQLEWAHQRGDLVDSGTLAQFLSTVLPADKRPGAPVGTGDAPARPRATPEVVSPRAAAPGHTPVPVIVDRELSAQVSRGGGGAGTDLRERKYVFVLQGLVRGLGSLERRLGRDGALRLLREFHGVAREVAYKHFALVDVPHEGTAIELGPEPGVRLVVGLPIASEDDAGHAIRLALALVDALDGIGSDVEPELRLAVGIQRGSAVMLRRPSSQEPHKIGFELEDATANFAYRLAKQARGAEVLVGGRVYRAARAEWTFESLPAIDLPVDGEPYHATRHDEETDPGIKRVRVYRLRGAKDRSQRLRDRARVGLAQLVGRELELKTLRDTYRDVVVSRRKRHVTIVGDTGVGKRTLISAFLDGLPPGEATVVRAVTRVGTAMTPFAVIADLVRDILGLAEDAEPNEVERRLLRGIPLLYDGDDGARLARAAVAALSTIVTGRPTAGATPLEPAQLMAQLLQILTRVEERIFPDRPMIIIGEDIHWADQQTQELFAALLRVPTPRAIFGLVTTRPEPRVMALVRELASGEILTVDELPPAACHELITGRFAPDDDVAPLVRQITDRAGGNPLFIGEILESLLERGTVVADGPDDEHPGLLRWALRDAVITIPSSIEDALATRFDGLPTSEREALVHAAVFGKTASASALSALLARPARLDLEALARRGLLVTDATGDEFSFKSEIAMTVAYALVPGDARARLHRQLAARMAQAATYRPGADDGTIARHLELAGDAAAAVERYLRAASHGMDLGGNADALRQLARALKLLPEADLARRYNVHKQREEILRRLARRPQQLRELHALRKAADGLADPARQAYAHLAQAQFYIDVGKAPQAARAIEPALTFARQAGDRLAEAEALRVRAVIARLVGNNDESLRIFDQALALCDQLDADPSIDRRQAERALTTRATLQNARGNTLWMMGALQASIESFAEALVIYRGLGVTRLEARALNNMGIVFAAMGEYEEALAHYKSALKLDQTQGDRSGIALKLANIGQCYADLGDLTQAETYLARGLALAEEVGDLAVSADAAISYGQAMLQRGDFTRALELLERGRQFATDNRERYQEIRALQYLALTQLRAKLPPEGALELARSTTELARRMPMATGIMFGLSFTALALSAVGRHDEALTAAREAIAALDAAPHPEGAEQLLGWYADVCTAAGQAEEAARAQARRATVIERKAALLNDPAMRAQYLASRPHAV